jgi:hypothetical protein
MQTNIYSAVKVPENLHPQKANSRSGACRKSGFLLYV